MNSKELNEVVGKLDSELGHAFDNGKPIPYIGWFWRQVNFDEKTYSFGVCPSEDGKPPYIGFMENNKWDYDYVSADEGKTAEIRQLIESAATLKTVEACKLANEAIQALGAKMITRSVEMLVVENNP